MANYLMQPGNLIVWPAFKEYTENDMFFCQIGVPVRDEMSGKELLDACLGAWQVKEGGPFQLHLKRADGVSELPIDSGLTIKEMGLRNGDALEIIAG